jgi:hypothetical protein
MLWYLAMDVMAWRGYDMRSPGGARSSSLLSINHGSALLSQQMRLIKKIEDVNQVSDAVISSAITSHVPKSR